MVRLFHLNWALVILWLGSAGLPGSRADDIIYDNTATFLDRVAATQTREYGDQIELNGTARLLTAIYFEYFAKFSTGTEKRMRVRLYANEKPHDPFRRSPSRVLYESGWLPLAEGYTAVTIPRLEIALPRDTVTFTIAFDGLEAGDEAGLLLYSPPTYGFSFNEFWRRTRDNTGWEPFLYSRTDLSLKANAALRLTAIARPERDQAQESVGAWASLRDRNQKIRLAQTFVPKTGGRLEQIRLWAARNETGSPVTARIVDTVNDKPGTQVLGTATLPALAGGKQSIYFTNQPVYLVAGRTYALELATEAPSGLLPGYSLRCSPGDTYPEGKLWFQHEIGGDWVRVTLYDDGLTEMDAWFELHLWPGLPRIRVTSPAEGTIFEAGSPVPLRVEVAVPEGKTPSNVRFFLDQTEVGLDPAAPFEATAQWVNAGEHLLTAIVEDSTRATFQSDPVRIQFAAANFPSNDDFGGRITLAGLPARGEGVSLQATLQQGEPKVGTNTANATLWWSWTAPSAAPIMVSVWNSGTAGAALSVFTGTRLSSLVPVAQGIGYCVFTPNLGLRYAIAVDPKLRGDRVTLELGRLGLKIRSVTNEAGAARLEIAAEAAPHFPVTLQSSQNLVAWESIVSGTTSAEGVLAWAEEDLFPNGQAQAQPRRFYRVQYGP